MINPLGERLAITEETSAEEVSNGPNQVEVIAADFHDEETPINEQLYDQLTKSTKRNESVAIEIPMKNFEETPINEQFDDQFRKSKKINESVVIEIPMVNLEETPMNEQFDDQLRTSRKRKESLAIEVPMEDREETGGSKISHQMKETTPLSTNTNCKERDIQSEKSDTEPQFEQVEILETSNSRNGNYCRIILSIILNEPRVTHKISRERKESKNIKIKW